MGNEITDRIKGYYYNVLYVTLCLGYKPGSFTELIIHAFFAADNFNFRKLEKAFPEIAAAVELYREHGADLYLKIESKNKG